MKSISSKLKESIKNHCNEFMHSSYLFKLGRDKRINPHHVTLYIENLEYLFLKNEAEILNSAKSYDHDPKLAEFFYSKWKEERGHDAWAKKDRSHISGKFSLQQEPTILPEMEELIAFVARNTKESPYRHMTYMFAAEYMTLLLGPAWIEILNSNLGIESYQVSSLSNHIGLDVEHVAEGGEFFDSLKLDDSIQKEILSFLDELFQFYNKFFTALAYAGEIYEQRKNQESLRPVPSQI